jgi:hypothetical protein
MALVTKNFSDIITFTRASTGTFFNSAGVLTSAATNAPRFDFNPSTLAAQGLLIEESRANLLLQSGWAGATSGSPGAAPTSWGLGFGTGTVTTVVSSTAGPIASAVRFDYDNTERVYFDQTITVTSGTQYAFSIYVEALSGVVAGDVLYVVSGTTTATINTFVTSPSATGRYTLLFTANGNGTVILRAGAGTSAAVGGTGSITLSRPQCEAGSFATSYIPTTTTALTRAADVASVNTLSPWYNASAGTLYAEVMLYALPPASTFPCYVDINNGTTNERFALSSNQFANHRVTVRNTAGNIWDTNAGGSIVANIASKWALAATSGDFSSAYNGIAGAVSSATGMPAGLTQMTIGAAGGGANRANGYLRRITYYPRRLSNAELQAITTTSRTLLTRWTRWALVMSGPLRKPAAIRSGSGTAPTCPRCCLST